ncbi:uncharacterized protein LTR77_000397 [Saxophila tyrrhenica]|uniref:Mitochondrial pyruvate carrier n=1 Tax=Saxophila tyrrhenica TaxID=1690608 RepID=A0AAV9PP34_9PEZI|nr:hypothetical protein LTR77_000397 [Saxophila tyrrhenica]
MSARLGMRFGAAMRQSVRPQMRTTQRRFQSTTATQPEASGLSKFLNSEVGPKTVHFWAPIMKWGLVLAGAADFTRPASQLSLTQNLALMCTGAIWTRWCFVIKPRNLFLASVNFLLFCVGATQVTRVLSYQSELKGQTMGEMAMEKAKEGTEKVEQAAKEPGKVKEAVVGK